MTKRYTRRKFLALGGAGGTALVAGIVRAPAATPAVTGVRRAMPPPVAGLVPYQDLPHFELDMEATNRPDKRGRYQIRAKPGAGGKTLAASRIGGVIHVPAGARIDVPWYVARFSPRRFDPGARIIFEGPKVGKRPYWFGVHSTGIKIPGETRPDPRKFPTSLEFERIHLDYHNGSGTVGISNGRFLRLTGCLVSGGSNGMGCLHRPSIIHLEDTEFHHAGRPDDNLKHGIYMGHCQHLRIVGCTIHATPWSGHNFKSYAASLYMADTTIATYLEPEDFEWVWSSGPIYTKEGLIEPSIRVPAKLDPKKRERFMIRMPCDIGGWAQTVLVNNTIIRRGPVQIGMIDYRNRQYDRSRKDQNPMRGAPDDWGTYVPDYHEVDNREDAEGNLVKDEHLFKHLNVNTRFVNGVLPDGSPDPFIQGAYSGGVAIRNMGANPWRGSGIMALDEKGQVVLASRPKDWLAQNQRCVVWVVNPKFEGVPYGEPAFREYWPKKRDPADIAPIRVRGDLPSWAKELL